MSSVTHVPGDRDPSESAHAAGQPLLSLSLGPTLTTALGAAAVVGLVSLVLGVPTWILLRFTEPDPVLGSLSTLVTVEPAGFGTPAEILRLAWMGDGIGWPIPLIIAALAASVFMPRSAFTQRAATIGAVAGIVLASMASVALCVKDGW